MINVHFLIVRQIRSLFISVTLSIAILLKPTSLCPHTPCRIVYEIEGSYLGSEYSALLSGSHNSGQHSTAPGHEHWHRYKLLSSDAWMSLLYLVRFRIKVTVSPRSKCKPFKQGRKRDSTSSFLAELTFRS
jgi:hypothetical protein